MKSSLSLLNLSESRGLERNNWMHPSIPHAFRRARAEPQQFPKLFGASSQPGLILGMFWFDQLVYLSLFFRLHDVEAGIQFFEWHLRALLNGLWWSKLLWCFRRTESLALTSFAFFARFLPLPFLSSQQIQPLLLWELSNLFLYRDLRCCARSLSILSEGAFNASWISAKCPPFFFLVHLDGFVDMLALFSRSS